MASQAVLTLPRVEAPGIDEAFLSLAQWQAAPSITLVRAQDGELASLSTEVRAVWSARGIHVCFCCADPLPLSRDFDRDAPIEEEEAVGVFLDPGGERSQYMALLVSPYARVSDARVENPHHRGIDSEIDESWTCAGVRVRAWSSKVQWVIELLIPFAGITPAIDTPSPGDRWTGNFYRIERHPFTEISAWQPILHTPVDLHASDRFGILVFG